MIRACAAVGGWRTAKTLSRRWIRSRRRADFDDGFSLMVCAPSTESLRRQEYRRPYPLFTQGMAEPQPAVAMRNDYVLRIIRRAGALSPGSKALRDSPDSVC